MDENKNELQEEVTAPVEETATEEVAEKTVAEETVAETTAEEATEETAVEEAPAEENAEEVLPEEEVEEAMEGDIAPAEGEQEEQKSKWPEIWDKITTGILILLMASPILILLYIFLWFLTK